MGFWTHTWHQKFLCVKGWNSFCWKNDLFLLNNSSNFETGASKVSSPVITKTASSAQTRKLSFLESATRIVFQCFSRCRCSCFDKCCSAVGLQSWSTAFSGFRISSACEDSFCGCGIVDYLGFAVMLHSLDEFWLSLCPATSHFLRPLYCWFAV